MFSIFKNLFSQNNDEALSELINDGAYLVDVRTAGEYAGGSVKNAVNIPLDKVQSQLSKFKNKKHVVVFCRSGNRSSQAKSILVSNGFNNVTNGGTWQNVNKYSKN